MLTIRFPPFYCSVALIIPYKISVLRKRQKIRLKNAENSVFFKKKIKNRENFLTFCGKEDTLLLDNSLAEVK